MYFGLKNLTYLIYFYCLYTKLLIWAACVFNNYKGIIEEDIEALLWRNRIVHTDIFLTQVHGS
jgi:hypothetical protein